MTPEQKAAFIMAQTACMLVELEAMRAENLTQDPPPHSPDAFRALPERYGVHHNAVLTWMPGA